MTNILLCGGQGTRLWPISRSLMPKQFNKLFNNKSLFQLTVERNSKLSEKILIVSNTEQYFLALDQFDELGISTKEKYLLEPIGRNTAPAIALACFSLAKDEIVLVSPSDHLIDNEEAYAKVMAKAIKLAHENYLVTFGITPTFAEIGFGYIEANGEDVQAFHEKPNFETAQKYIDAGNYYWNSGMFCFKAGIFLDELKKYAPNIYEKSLLAYENAKNQELIRINYEDMMQIDDESIDYAVMEKSTRVKVVASDIGWSDVGSFDALYDILEKDLDFNTKNKNLISIESKNNLVLSDEKMIALIDIEDLIIVNTSDALLISKKGSSQKVKKIVSKLKEKNSELVNIHQTVHRPWGTYTILEDTLGYKIKRIVVKSGKRLSLQKHYHRNEHWIVVSGTATVTVGEETMIVRPNESTYIKMGEIHRLANNGVIDVVLIEAQVGEYTGEDDIVRLEDDFKRK